MSRVRDQNPVEEKPQDVVDGPPPWRGFRHFVHEQRRVLLTLLVLAVIVAFVFAVLPQIAGFGTTLSRLSKGNKLWLLLGAVFEAISLGGYIALFRTVFSCAGVRIGWSASYQITMAGVVATKLISTAGAGGIALMAWALSAAGLRPATIARRIAAFVIIQYAVFMAALVIFGVGLKTGLLPGGAPFYLTVIPAVFGAVAILVVLAFMLVPPNIEARLRERTIGSSTRSRGRFVTRLATIPDTVRSGLATAIEIVKSPSVGLLGAVAYWGFDIATLWACFHAFGASPPFAVVVMAYFIGQLAAALPLPGGIGPVEGGMIGSFLAFGVDGSVAILAVLAYRALSFWLPTVPGGSRTSSSATRSSAGAPSAHGL